MREVYFMDTSILVNILQIPGMSQCQGRVMEDLKDYISRKAVLILPLATIIETGNHIAHISNGDIRLKCAKKMATFLQKTVAGEAPWTYNKNELVQRTRNNWTRSTQDEFSAARRRNES